MLKRLLLLPLVFLSFMPAFGQQNNGWCGYALISGLPLLEGQLSVLEAITPPKSESVNPSQLFQHRFNLTHTEVIIEGCFGAFPTQELIASLLQQVIAYDPKAMESIVATIDFDKGPVTESDVVAAYIEEKLTYTIFEGSREESAARVRAYLSVHLKDWELTDETLP